MSVYCQKNDTIYKTDGTKIIADIGYFSLKKNNFIYSKGTFKKASEIPGNEVSKVVILNHKSDKTFVTTHKPLNKNKKKKNLEFTEIILEGYCELYKEVTVWDLKTSTVDYFLKRPQEFAGTRIKADLLLHKKRNEILIEYFSDCPKVISFIKSLGKIGYQDLIQIVEKYNAECSK